jgi:hypothetical protein
MHRRSFQKPGSETREESVARILRTGQAALSVDDLYGPGPGPDDPEDLEAFLDLLNLTVITEPHP